MGKKNIDYRKSVTRQITFPSKLMDMVDSRAKMFGYSFPEYVRYVLTKDIDREDFYLGTTEYIDDKELVDTIKEGIKEYEEGKCTTLSSPEEIDAYFASLDDDE